MVLVVVGVPRQARCLLLVKRKRLNRLIAGRRRGVEGRDSVLLLGRAAARRALPLPAAGRGDGHHHNTGRRLCRRCLRLEEGVKCGFI